VDPLSRRRRCLDAEAEGALRREAGSAAGRGGPAGSLPDRVETGTLAAAAQTVEGKLSAVDPVASGRPDLAAFIDKRHSSTGRAPWPSCARSRAVDTASLGLVLGALRAADLRFAASQGG